jgi:transcription antitermination factor NusG
MRWIVVQVKSQCEDLTVENLEESGFRCFYPRLTVQRGAKVEKRPMFPGYIFVEIDLLDMPKWRTIKSHRGAIKMLMLTSGCPGVLPTGLVEAMIERGDLLADFNDVVKLVKGQKIRFTAGPLSGIHGVIQWTNKERVSLLVDLLGRETLVQSTTNLVSPI